MISASKICCKVQKRHLKIFVNSCYIYRFLHVKVTMVANCLAFVYVIVWVAVVFGINCASNAGRKLVIVRGAAVSTITVSCLHYESN